MVRIAALCLAYPLSLLAQPASGCSDSDGARYQPRTFLGYACEDDCQRHKAGFHWAEQWAVTDARSCESLGRLEAQGCRAYVDESFDAQAAGERWATENEIADRCLCNGAGEGFRAGCTDAARMPFASSP